MANIVTEATVKVGIFTVYFDGENAFLKRNDGTKICLLQMVTFDEVMELTYGDVIECLCLLCE